MRGSCHCGAIEFKTTGKPIWLGRCHCKDCQKISSTAFMTFAGFKISNVEFTKGTPHEYKSSENVTRTFCGNCGSAIEWRDNSSPDETNIALGLFDDNSKFDVIDDIWLSEKVSWGNLPNGHA